MKQIIITGAGGLVATELTCLLMQEDGYELYLISRDSQKLRERYVDNAHIHCFSLGDFEMYVRQAKHHFDVLIHTAFSRSSEGKLLAESLDYQQRVLLLAKYIPLHTFINISSQSIYGQDTPPFWTEETLPAPNYPYALAKYAAELITNVALMDTSINFTNVRLCSVCENARFLNVFVQNALQEKPIKVIGGNQKCSFIDVRDVASALKTMIDKSKSIRFECVYNVGTGANQTIVELAQCVQEMAKVEYGCHTNIQRENADISLDVGMDVSLFKTTFLWEPKYDYRGMIKGLFEYVKNPSGGGYPVAFSFVY